MCCLTHRSMVACCIGVVVVPGLTAVNGPVFMDDIKALTGTLVLWGLLLRQEGDTISGRITRSLNLQRNLCDGSHVCDLIYLHVNSLCVSQLFTCCLCVLLGPGVTAHTPPTRARTVHLQDISSWREAHWREEWHKERKKRWVVLFQALFLCLCVMRKCERETGVCFFTRKGSVDRKARHTSYFVLSSGTVMFPVTGFVYRDELHRVLAEEVFAVNQLLNCRRQVRSEQHSAWTIWLTVNET